MDVVSLPQLDVATLVFSIAVLTGFMGAVTLTMAPAMRGMGLDEWSRAMFLCAGAFVLYFMRGYTPLALSHLLANLLALGAGAYCIAAYAKLLEVRRPTAVITLLTGIGVTGLLAGYLGMTTPHATVSVSLVGISLALAAEYGYIAYLIRTRAFRLSRTLAWSAGLTMGVLAVIFAVRVILALFGAAPPLMPARSYSPQLVVMLVGIAFFALSTTAFIGMASERHRNETLHLLRRDVLTGLYTRTAFFEMQPDIERVGKAHGYAVVMFDIDHFKTINDRYGHAGGDAVLAHAARLIVNSARISDIVVRYGGEEFCVLLKDCSEQDTARFAERVVSDTRAQQVRLKDGRHVTYTVSAGFATRTPGVSGGESLEACIERADAALYQAKNAGRNRATGQKLGGGMLQGAPEAG